MVCPRRKEFEGTGGTAVVNRRKERCDGGHSATCGSFEPTAHAQVLHCVYACRLRWCVVQLNVSHFVLVPSSYSSQCKCHTSRLQDRRTQEASAWLLRDQRP